MPEIPECLQRRYQALDDLIRELSVMSHCSSENVDPGIKLMCNFWNILKDEPDCNLAEEVHQCFSPPSENSSCFSYCGNTSPYARVLNVHHQRYQCYMAHGSQGPPGEPPKEPPKNSSKDPPKNSSNDPLKSTSNESSLPRRCGKSQTELEKPLTINSPQKSQQPSQQIDQPATQQDDEHAKERAKVEAMEQQAKELKSKDQQANEQQANEQAIEQPPQEAYKRTVSNASLDRKSPRLVKIDNQEVVRKNPAMVMVPPDDQCKTPLAKVLTNLEQAASYDSSCSKKLKELLAAQKHLKCQIARLEEREKAGVQLMKEADQMWAGMENAYKEKIAESLERQNDLMKQLQDIEKSAAKWRKNKRDLESQLDSINKCQMEMVTKINQKTNDLKSINAEVEAYKKRIEDTKKEAEAVKAAMTNKTKSAEGRIAKITLEITSLEKQLREESKHKKDKQLAGKAYIQEARADLQNICKVLLQRRLEHEDLEAEKIALIQEIEMLKDCCNNCKDRCGKKQKDIGDEIKRIDIEIANYELKCVKCTVCVDSMDARTLCSDCPRCEEQRQCIIDGDTKICKPDAVEECVCSKVKQMFLNNVLENMSTVLEKKVKTCTGKALGNEIMKCLNKSRNGKLNDRTKRLLQEFVLQTVKKNLNLTIVGGAVKTRCELDPETYKQLMLCLKKVKAKPPPKSDKGCDVKKDPCSRWGGPNDCNCPKGPKNCICTRKAPPPVKDPETCPPEPPDDPGEEVICPHKNEPCGPECGAHSVDRVGAEVAQFRPDPCSAQSCPFGKNMRAAQCVLGPESLKSPSKSNMLQYPPDYSFLDNKGTCKCGKATLQDHLHSNDRRTIPRELMIEEVMGEYIDVKTIDSVALCTKDLQSNELKRRVHKDGVRSNNAYANFKTDAISSRISQTSSYLAKDDLKLVLPKSIEDIEQYKKQNMFSRLKNGRGHQTEIEFTKYQGIDSTGHRLASGYCSASSSKNLKPLSSSSSDSEKTNNAKQLIADKINKRLTPFESISSKPIGISGVGSNKIVEDEAKDLKQPKITNNNPFMLKPYPLKVDNCTDSLVPYPRTPLGGEKFEVSQEVKDYKKANTDSFYQQPYINSKVDTGTDSLVPYPRSPSGGEKNIVSQTTNENFVAVTVSPSGSITMKLDENLINRLINNAREDFVYLKITNSGRCFLNLIQVAKLDEILLAKLQIKRMSRDKIVFDVVPDERSEAEHSSESSNLIEVVKAHNSQTPDFHLTREEQKRIRSIIKLKSGRQHFSPQDANQVKYCAHTNSPNSSKYQEHLEHFEETIYKNEKELKKLHVCKGYKKEMKRYKNELEKLYENNSSLSINIIAENGISMKVTTSVKKTLSGNLALDVKVIDNIGEISSLKSEYPVCIYKSSSGRYNIFIGNQSGSNDIVPNAVIRRTESNGLLVVLTKPKLNFSSERISSNNDINDTYRVRVSYSSDKKHLPALLKSSPSHNYLVIMDKEFENRFVDSINTAFGDNTECFVELRKKSSVISIYFDETAKKNAALVKTPSGTIKMLVTGPIFENLIEKVSKISTSSQELEGILEQSSDSPEYTFDEKGILNVKSSSDPNFYKKNNLNYSLFAGSKPKFQMMKSGQYAAILDKESKKYFLNDLKNQIAKYPKNRIPIKQTDSGEITIILDSDGAGLSQFESLKITPSGNLYVVVDDDTIEEIKYMESKQSAMDSNQTEFGSEHMIGKTKVPKNKATATCGKQKSDYIIQSEGEGELFSNKNVGKPYSYDIDSVKSKADSYYFTESLYRYEDERLSMDIIEVTSLCNRLLNDVSKPNSKSSLKSVSIESNSSARWNVISRIMSLTI